jgi:hypothetical protein
LSKFYNCKQTILPNFKQFCVGLTSNINNKESSISSIFKSCPLDNSQRSFSQMGDIFSYIKSWLPSLLPSVGFRWLRLRVLVGWAGIWGGLGLFCWRVVPLASQVRPRGSQKVVRDLSRRNSNFNLKNNFLSFSKRTKKKL